MCEDEIECSSDNLGIVFPVYMLGAPLIVTNFIKKLKVSKNTYTFVIANHGAKPGPGGTVLQIKNLMKAQGIELGSIFTIEMINNYTPLFGMVEDEKQWEVFNDAKEKIDTIVDTVKNKSAHKPDNIFRNIIQSMFVALNKIFVPISLKEDNKFWTDDNCSGCGLCEKLCPMDNITLTEGKPEWHNNCQQCVSCFNLCPQQAIQLGKKSQDSGRYKNPKITVDEILSSNSTKQG